MFNNRKTKPLHCLEHVKGWPANSHLFSGHIDPISCWFCAELISHFFHIVLSAQLYIFLLLPSVAQSMSPTSLALPYILGTYLSAWRGAGCGVEKLLLEVLFQSPRVKICRLLSPSCAPGILCTEHCLIQLTTLLWGRYYNPHFADKEMED